MSALQPDDVARAARGDLAAMRRMRDHWFDLSTGALVIPLLPKQEALLQFELLAELAANGSGEPEDCIVLALAYQLRAESLTGDIGAAQHFARVAAAAENVDDLDRWTRSEVEFTERLEYYRAKVGGLVNEILGSPDAGGTAMLVNTLSLQADRGDERAVPLLQYIMDSVTPERGQAIKAEVLRIEGATVQ